MSTAPENSPAHADLGMAWGLKDSFRQYLHRIGDATWSFEDGAAITTGGELYFPLREIERTDDGRIGFAGVVVIEGHFGMLRVKIERPEVQLDGRSGSLWTGGVRLLDLHSLEETREAGVAMWEARRPALSQAAVMIFGDAYPAGEVMSPLRVRIPTSIALRRDR